MSVEAVYYVLDALTIDTTDTRCSGCVLLIEGITYQYHAPLYLCCSFLHFCVGRFKRKIETL